MNGSALFFAVCTGFGLGAMASALASRAWGAAPLGAVIGFGIGAAGAAFGLAGALTTIQ